MNRQFLHPLGLALEVIIDDEGEVFFGGVWDYRDDPEGLIYSEDAMDDQFIIRAKNVENLLDKKSVKRKEEFGWVVQPVKS